MRVLLIAPPGVETINSDLIRLIHEERGLNPPIGLLYIATCIRESRRHDVRILDAAVEKLSIDVIRRHIEGVKPHVLGIPLTTFSLLEGIGIARAAKKVDAGIKVMVGGIHPFIFPRETIALDCFDYALVGEAERTVVELLDCLESGESPSGIKGLVYRQDGQVAHTGNPELIEDLDSIPIPDRTMLPYTRYNSLIARKNPVSIMITSRGCPFRCTFCDRPHLGKRFRVRSASNVVEEFRRCRDLGIREILVYDDTFTVNKDRVMEICRLLIAEKIDIYWGIRARVDTVDRRMLEMLKMAGCVRVNYGVESGSPEVLKRLRKEITLERTREVFRMTRDCGMDALAYFMIGCPGEALEDIERTVEFAKSIRSDYVHFSILMPFPSTEVYSEAMEKGIIKSDVWRQFAADPRSDFEIPVYGENFSRQELIRLLAWCNKSFYFRPSYILRQLLRTRSPGQLYREGRAALKLLCGGG